MIMHYLTFPSIWSAIFLAFFLCSAVWSDVRERRIPNAVVAGGMVCGLLVHALSPAGDGLFSPAWGSPGLVHSLLGLLAGFGLFLPLHLLRAIGAGDVKLMAMVGVWLGPKLVFGAALLTLVAGGLLAIVMMLGSGTGRRVLSNVRMLLTTSMIGVSSGRITPLDMPASGGPRLPYALAIMVGTLAQVGWQMVQSSP